MPEKLKKLLSCAIIHILVGDDLKDFGVHKDLVCHHSPFFNAALTSEFFEEGKTGIMKLPEVEVEVFELFYHWLYTQDLHLPVWDQSESSSEVRITGNLGKAHSVCAFCNKEDTYSIESAYDSDSCSLLGFTHHDRCHLHLFCKKQLKLLSKLYVFADMTQIPVLQNTCIKTFHEIVNLGRRVPVELIEFIWENTTDDDRLRKLIVDMMVWEKAPEFSLFVPNPIPNLILDEVHSAMRRHFRAAVHKRRGSSSNPLWDIENYLTNSTNFDKEEDSMGFSGMSVGF